MAKSAKSGCSANLGAWLHPKGAKKPASASGATTKAVRKRVKPIVRGK